MTQLAFQTSPGRAGLRRSVTPGESARAGGVRGAPGSTTSTSARGGHTSPASPTPSAPGEGPRRTRRNSEHRRLVELGERLARERHPEATEINVNPAHECGPVIEVWGRSGFLGLYGMTGWEL